jgi:hypothetical protein
MGEDVEDLIAEVFAGECFLLAARFRLRSHRWSWRSLSLNCWLSRLTGTSLAAVQFHLGRVRLLGLLRLLPLLPLHLVGTVRRVELASWSLLRS